MENSLSKAAAIAAKIVDTGLFNMKSAASSIATPLDRTNVDTDQIIPKQFLKSTHPLNLL